MELKLNEFQSTLAQLDFDSYPDEVKEQFMDFINNVPYIGSLISKDRKRARDLERDSSGKIIVDLIHPHIIEDMDYFRPSAIHFQKYGKYTNLTPNSNPSSPFGRWIKEEARRCREGYVRESDGEWITGDYYFFLNYCPMSLLKKRDANSRKAMRVIDFPLVWEGHYLLTHYLYQAREHGHHASELASRSKGKSFLGAALLTKRFILGESEEVNKKVVSYITANDKKYLVNGDQTLDKFIFDIDWCAEHTEFPSKRLINSIQNMQWEMGYKDLDTNTNKGTLNSVVGVSSNDDESKLRGTRGVLYVIEEWGTFPRLLAMYTVLRKSVEDGNDVFGTIFAYGTAGDNDSDFRSAQEIMYNPIGYNMEALENVFDKIGQGKKLFVFFFPGYMNLAGCYNSQGVSDVTKALLMILNERYIVKYNSTDLNTIIKTVAEVPITPQEAVLKTQGNLFPVTLCNERIMQLDDDPTAYSTVAIGDIVKDSSGKYRYVPTNDIPIRQYPLKDNKAEGAIEFYDMPIKDKDGKVPAGRYIGGLDPIDDDVSNTMSLVSCYIMDSWTDRVVCTWTGRLSSADACFDRVMRMAAFYNAEILYENDKKGCFAYFNMHQMLHLLSDIPEYLKDKYSEKGPLWGNKLKGYKATAPINNYANSLIKEWLVLPNTIQENGKETQVPNISLLKDRALLQECVAFNPVINVDRIRAFGAMMLKRQEKIILYGGDVHAGEKIHQNSGSAAAKDEFFTNNFEKKFNIPVVDMSTFNMEDFDTTD